MAGNIPERLWWIPADFTDPSPAFLEEGRRLRPEGRWGARSWSRGAPRERHRAPGPALSSSAATSAHSRRQAVRSDSCNGARASSRTPANGKLRAELRTGAGRLSVLAFAPDGKTLACADGHGGVALWDVAARKVRARLKGHAHPIYSLAWTADSKTLATVGYSNPRDKAVVLWDAALGKERQRLEVGENMAYLSALAFAPDGKTLAVVGGSGSIHLWDVAAGRQVAELKGHTDVVESVAFSPDGRILASGSQDCTLRLWDVPKLKP